MGGDTWACQTLTTRGSREVLLGIEVPRITPDFPMVDLQEATRELKNSTDNQKITGLTVPKQVGGHVDVLLGIQHSAHFPKLVHSLESGLGIYEIRLLADDPHITAAIAGPHPSFYKLKEKIGNTGATLATFTKGLDHWKLFGPSPIKSMYLKPAIAPNLTGSPDIVTTLPEESTQHFLPVPREPQKNCGRIPTHTQEDIIDPAHFTVIFKPPKEVRILAICAKFVKTFTREWKKYRPDQQPGP